ncbi:hypothetical protein [Chitinophaga sp. CB10]|uniref:hypothetical protein n=1 Tax=Chitinophaga sp. CB10 TaxID=1891659 RepID=UPI000AF67E8A|nr:hypothetical protein [Chitinophaga sp. CB10]
MKKLLLIVTNVDKYASGLATGLWLSELTHIYHKAKEKNWDITIASPKGGKVPIDPESLKPLVLDKISKDYYEDPKFMDELNHSKSLHEVINESFDCVYLAGGMLPCMIFQTMQILRISSANNTKRVKWSLPSVTA